MSFKGFVWKLPIESKSACVLWMTVIDAKDAPDDLYDDFQRWSLVLGTRHSDTEWKRADIRIPWSDPDKFDPQAHPDLVCVLGASIKGMLQLAPVTESVKSFMQNLIRTYERAVDDSLEYKTLHQVPRMRSLPDLGRDLDQLIVTSHQSVEQLQKLFALNLDDSTTFGIWAKCTSPMEPSPVLAHPNYEPGIEQKDSSDSEEEEEQEQ